MKYLLIAPPLAFFFAISLVPLVYTIWLSLRTANIAGGGTWIGVDNYVGFSATRSFAKSYGNTVLYVVSVWPCNTVLGLALALAVHGLTRGQRPLRLLILLPFVIAPLIVGFIWQTMFDSRYGPLSGLLRALGIGPVAWLNDPKLAFISILDRRHLAVDPVHVPDPLRGTAHAAAGAIRGGARRRRLRLADLRDTPSRC